MPRTSWSALAICAPSLVAQINGYAVHVTAMIKERVRSSAAALGPRAAAAAGKVTASA